MGQKQSEKIVLICSTINPSLCLVFLRSLKYTKCDYKLIIINVSDKKFVLSNLDQEIKSKITLYNLPSVSLSIARNFALSKVDNPNILAFPDDDCQYPIGILDRVLEKFRKNKDPNLKGICFDFPGKKKNASSKIYKDNIFGNCISFNFFLFNPKSLLFNEDLGIGAKFDFGEESDFLSRILKDKFYLFNSKKFLINHPIKTGNSFKKTIRQGIGIGGFLVLTWKNQYNITLKLKFIFGPLFKSVLQLLKGKFLYSLDSLISFFGRIIGLIKSLIYLLNKKE